MKNLVLVLVFFLSSCALVDSVRNAFDVTYEVGKVRGRKEVLDDLVENKKKLDEINNLVLQEAIMLVQKKQDEEGGDKLIQFVIPLSANYLMLLRERNNLKKELAVADKNAQAGKKD